MSKTIVVKRRKYKTLRNVKLSELVHVCKSNPCDECPFQNTCFCLCNLFNFDEKMLNHRIKLKYTYSYTYKKDGEN